MYFFGTRGRFTFYYTTTSLNDPAINRAKVVVMSDEVAITKFDYNYHFFEKKRIDWVGNDSFK